MFLMRVAVVMEIVFVIRTIKKWINATQSVRNCDFEKNEIAKNCWEADYSFSWNQKNAVDSEIVKAGWFSGRLKKQYILWRILIALTKIFTCFLKYVATITNEIYAHLTFASVKLYCLITLIGCIAQLLSVYIRLVTKCAEL